jgi:hypothetical protein
MLEIAAIGAGGALVILLMTYFSCQGYINRKPD